MNQTALTVILTQADALAQNGRLAAALALLSPHAADPAARLDLAQLCLDHHRPRDAARHARALLRQQPDHPAAAIILAAALLELGSPAAARQALPARLVEATAARQRALQARANLGILRQQGAALWQTGEFEAGHALYEELHALEAELRRRYRRELDAAPAGLEAWRVLLDAANNYRLHHALASALPEPDMVRRAFLACVTGNPDHPVQQHRHILAARFHALGAWPEPREICAAVTPPPRHYQPGRIGTAQPPLAAATLPPRQTIKLENALAYDAGLYLFVCAQSGYAPWLQGGMWGRHLAEHLHFVVPPPFSRFDGAAPSPGLGHVVGALPMPAQTIDRPVAVLGYWNNHGHVLHDVLPQLQDAENLLGRDFAILAVDGLIPSVREAFALMGYPSEKLLTIGACRSARLREAYCFSPRTVLQQLRRFQPALPPPHRHYDVALDDAGLDFVRERLQPARPVSAAWRKIYVSRRGTGRAPENEAAIESLLAVQGFTVLQPDTLPLAEQIALFGETRILLGLEGAALANALFMPPGGEILVLRSLAWGWTVNCFDELARHGHHQIRHFDFSGRIVPLAELTAWLNLRSESCKNPPFTDFCGLR